MCAFVARVVVPLTHSLTVLCLTGSLTATCAQVNILSDLINFRGSGQQSQTTQHYGKLRLDASSSTAPSLDVYNNTTGNYTNWGIRAQAVPAANYGYGAELIGGKMGLYARASLIGTGYRYGAWLQGQNGNTANYGAYVAAMGPSGSTNYGIYASASGGTTNWAGYFTGQIYVAGSVYPSDDRLKLNENKVQNALERIMALKPVTYDYDTATYRKLHLPAGKQTGLVAQHVETVLPELVTEVPMPAPDDETPTDQTVADDMMETFKGVNYNGLIALLIAAVQEQQATIEKQDARVRQLEVKAGR